MNKHTAYTGNLHALATAVDTLVSGRPQHRGICLAHGVAGAGKTWALRQVASKFDAVVCTALPFWTAHAMLAAIGRALGATPPGRTTAAFDQLARLLRARPRPLMIDEGDRIADRPALLETLRILHDLSGAPLVLAGMDGLRRAIARQPQVGRRIAHEIAFGPLGAEDARKVAAARGEPPLADDLIEELRIRSGGIVSYFCDALATAEGYARQRGNGRAAPTANAAPGQRAPKPLTLHDYRARLGPPPRPARFSPATPARDASRSVA